MGSKMSKKDDNDQKKLEILYDTQAKLLDQLHIYQKNLHRSLSKKAKYGIDVPNMVLNEIEQEETEILNIKKQLAETQAEIDSLTTQDNKLGIEEVPSYLSLDGVDYKIETPYPFIRSETTQEPANNQLCTKIYYAGGFEIHGITKLGGGMSFLFYVHGRRVAPLLDTENKKLIRFSPN